MAARFELFAEITDDVIRQAWATTTEVKFSGRPFNYVAYRQISFGDLGWWLPLKRVLTVVGITPTQLLPVFGQPKTLIERHTFWSRLGLAKKKAEWVVLNPRTTLDSYDELGSIGLGPKSFQPLADLFGKSILVYREDGGTGGHEWRFTVHPTARNVRW